MPVRVGLFHEAGFPLRIHFCGFGNCVTACRRGGAFQQRSILIQLGHHPMPVQIQYQPDDICVLRISGILNDPNLAQSKTPSPARSTWDRNLACSSFLKTLRVGSVARIGGMISIFFFCIAVKFPRSPSSLSHVGSLSRSLLPERASVARR